MEIQGRKKKKTEVLKVNLLRDKLQNNSFQVKGSENAYFPYQPYPEQTSLIKNISRAITSQQNALVQSPTGTGKTLCMLVAGLSSVCTISAKQNQKVPKIYYLTRTHSQITQVVNQLKRLLWYQCKLNIIASRQHLCINRNLKQLKGRMLDRGCQQMCKQKLCKYKQQTKQSSLPIKQWLTLEQLSQKGRKKTFCPFYYSKSATDKCQITVMPFNYLLDWNLFQHNSFSLKNSIIIFDQAHNVDSLAEQGSSLQIDTDNLAQAFLQLKSLEQSSKNRYLHKKFQIDDQQLDSANISLAKNLVVKLIAMLKQKTQEINYNSLQDMLSILKKITIFVNKQQQIYPGIDLNNYEQLLFDLDKVRKLFSQKKLESEQFEIFCSTLAKIMKLLDSNSSNIDDYYMSVGPKNQKSFSLKLNCLNASFTFQRITEQKPRSIILCSGTLGPLEIWQKQLGVQFKTKIKIPSFITKNQVCISIVNQNYEKNIRFQFSFQQKGREDQFEALGLQLKQLQKHVPNGIVVTFSTYQLMQKSMKCCLDLTKPVFYQSKNENIDQIYGKYSQAARTRKGAFLFIVMKGKFSQGINFNDQLCRCLIVVGIPFLPPNDYKIIRKKSYIQDKFGRQAAEQWYYSQTFKSVNQVIGRAIRSKKDYGCILLFDQRYNRKDMLKELPSWFTSNLMQLGFVKYTEKVRSFFANQQWLNCENNSQKNIKSDNSFEHAIQKTIPTKDFKVGNSFQALLNHQTPAKIKKPKKVLMIESEQQQNVSKQKSGKKNRIFKEKAKQNSMLKKKEKPVKLFEPFRKIQRKQTVNPWFSLQYFYGQELKDNLQTNQLNIRQKLQQTIHKQEQKIKIGNEAKLLTQQPQTEVQGQAILTIYANKHRNKKYI